jgi:hypothetical protein
VAEIVTDQVLVTQARHHLIPVGRVSQHRRADAATLRSDE